MVIMLIKLKRVKIRPKYNFMCGYPNEKISDLKRTTDLILRLLSDNPHSLVQPIQQITPYPGTVFYDESLNNGLKVPQSLDVWANYNCEELKVPWNTKRRDRILIDEMGTRKYKRTL